MKSRILTLKSFTLLLMALLFGASGAFGQTPQGINYQAVVRDANGAIAANTPVTFRFSFHEGSAGGTNRYTETRALTTDAYGMANHVLGTGTATSGTFAAVDWTKTNFLKTEIDLTGTFVVLGTEKFQSVPYALNAGGGAWATSGNNIYNTNTGNVGIGTNAPTDKLHVVGANPQLKIVNSANGADIAMSPSSTTSTGGVGTIGNYDLPLFTNSLDRVTIKAGGNVGIGTDNPSSKLTVFGGGPGIKQTDGTIEVATFIGGGINGGYIGTFSNHPFGLYTNNSVARLMVATNGNVGIRTTNPRSELEIEHATGSGPGFGFTISNIGASAHYWNMYVLNANDDLQLINHNGNMGSFNGISGTYTGVSDRKFKKDIERVGTVMPEVMQLDLMKYHFKSQSAGDRKFMGMIAQDVQPLFPEVVFENVSEDGTDSYLTMDYSAFGLIAIKGVQEQQVQIQNLQTTIDNQQAQIDALKAEIAAMKK